jgi:hypothetical protein
MVMGSVSAGTPTARPRRCSGPSVRPGATATSASLPATSPRRCSGPHPRLDRHGRPADQLPPVPPRALAVGAQRPDPGPPPGQARPVAGGGPVAVPGDRGVGRLRGHVLPGTDLRPRHDPPSAVEHMAAIVEAAAHTHGITDPLQMTIGATDGEGVWAFRYSSEGRSCWLFYSTKMHTLGQLYPDNRAFHEVSDDTRGSCRSRSATLPAPGTRCRSPATAWSTTARTSSTRSGRDCPSRVFPWTLLSERYSRPWGPLSQVDWAAGPGTPRAGGCHRRRPASGSSQGTPAGWRGAGRRRR